MRSGFLALCFISLSLFSATGFLRAQEPALPNDLKKLWPTGKADTLETVHGVVTCVQESVFYLQDANEAFAIHYPQAKQAVEAGDLIELECERRGFGRGLIVTAIAIRKQGKHSLPAVTPSTIDAVIGGTALYHRVAVKGSVHDVAISAGRLLLLVDDAIRSVSVVVPWPANDPTRKRPDELLDAVVEVTGIATPSVPYDTGSDRYWASLPVNSLADVRVIQPGASDPFTRPQQTLKAITEAPAPDLAVRQRVIGKVTYASQSGWFYIQDEAGFTARGRKPDLFSVAKETRRPVMADTNLLPGDVIELVGQVAPNRAVPGIMPWFIQCEWRVLKHDTPPKFQRVDPNDLFDVAFDGKPVSIAGWITDLSISDDPNGYVNHNFSLGGISALVQLREKIDVPVHEGTAVRINGVVKISPTKHGKVGGVRINVQSFDDVKKIPFAMNRSTFFNGALGVLVFVLVAIIWIVVLRRQVRRQTQALVAVNEDLLRFKKVADTTTDLVAMSSLDKTPLYINPAGRQMLGIGLNEDAATVDFESIYTRESLELFEREGFAHAFKHGHWKAEIKLRHRDGHEVPVSFSGLVLYKPDGSPLCMSCIAHDISQRIAAENQLRASLEHERELNQLKSGFVNTISHEFRTPLGIILFASSMLRRFNERFSPEERAAQLDGIDEAVERMNELVEQALSLGRAEVAAPKVTTFDLSKFSRRIIDEVMSATSHQSPIKLVCEDSLPNAHTDDMMLRTILANLLGNAVKYSPAGSAIELHVQHLEDHRVRFTVRDHGPGLSEDDLPKLFTTFHRGKGVEGIPGTGLGLAIVKRCTEALSGTVMARNAADGGAEFIVELPVFNPPS